MFLILIIFLQVILESMPVSSSGHLALFNKFFDLKISEALDYFLYGPTIIILMLLFYKEWSRPLLNLIRPILNILYGVENDSHRVMQLVALYRGAYKRLVNIFIKIVLFLLIADLVTGLILFLFKAFVIKQIWFNSNISLLTGFFITFLLLILLGLKRKLNYLLDMSFLFKAIILGLVQGLAMLPGISRFASVYVASRYLNIPTRRAFELTFLLQFSIIVPGFILGTYKLIDTTDWYNIFTLPVFFSIIFATIISFFVLSWCRKLAYKNMLWLFSFYMLLPISLLIYYSFYLLK